MADQPPAKGKQPGKKILGMKHDTGMFVVIAAIAGGGLLLFMLLRNRAGQGQQQQQPDTSGAGVYGPAGGQDSFMEIIKSTGGHQQGPIPIDQPRGHKPPRKRGRHDAGTLSGSAHNPKG